MDLFDFMRENTMDKESPLASRLRPATLDEVVGQQHIIGKDKPVSYTHLDVYKRQGIWTGRHHNPVYCD